MMRKKRRNGDAMKRKLLLIVTSVFLFITIYLCLVFLPYLNQSGVSAITQNSFDASAFYGNQICPDRAAILFDNNEALAERIRLISNASDSIILSTFDFKSDNSGRIMLSALYDAANRGVHVQILLDGFSYFTHVMGNSYFEAVATHENVTLKVYNPLNLLAPSKLMARMHDKYLIADHTAYILGGRNTYDYFLGNNTDYINYDWDVLIYNTGEAASSSLFQVKSYFQSVWELPDCKTVMSSAAALNMRKLTECREELSSLYEDLKKEEKGWFADINYKEMTVETRQVTLITNPINTAVKEPVLFYTMTELMKQSDGEIAFHTPYILCNDYMLERLGSLCFTNGNVRMMTNSVANNGNPFGAVDYKLHKKDLLAAGLKILEYDKGISYHGKCFTIGDTLTAVGSFNWDMRSAYLDTEIMLVIDSSELNQIMQEYMGIYEADALIVRDVSTYDLKEGQIPQKISSKRKWRIRLLQPFNSLFRYLM